MSIFNFVRLRSHFLIIAIIVIAVVSGIGISIDLIARETQDEPDLNVTVARFLPQGQTSQRTNITIHFSRNMVESDSLNQPVLSPPLVFDPPLPGLARWIEKDVLRFYPDQELAPATKYKIRVASDRSFLYGNRINDSRVFEIQTPPLSVSRVNWYPVFDPELSGTVRFNIDIQFNYDVDLQQLRKKIVIAGGTNAVQSRLEFDITHSTSTSSDVFADISGPRFAHDINLTTEPVDITENQQEYRLSIADGLLCQNCAVGLLRDYGTIMTITARERQYIRQINARISGRTGYLQIACQTPVVPDVAREFVSITPEVDYTIENRYNELILHGPFIPRETYTVTIAKGMPSEDGSLLDQEFSTMVAIPDIPPTVNFVSEGMYLPREGAKLLELETVNMDRLSVEVDQIFANNLVYALASSSQGRNLQYGNNLSVTGRRFFSTSVDLDGELNKPLTTTIDVGAIIGDTARGIYKIAARNLEGRWRYDTRLIMLTDIGILARMSENYMMVWVNSLSESKPLKDARVRLFSRNNQELLSDLTDSRGIAVFNKIAGALEGFEPFLITVEYKEDLSFLDLSETRLPISDFDVKGRQYHEGGYEAFLYSDRGVYRPGETVRVVSLVREADGSPPPEFPYIITVHDPSGREFMSFRVTTADDEAMSSLDIPLPDFSRTGKYSLVARVGEEYEIGRESFQVEEFIPDRIKVSVATDKEQYDPGDVLQAEVAAKFLFGPPASNQQVSGHITIEPYEFKPDRWSRFSFTDGERSFSRVEINLPDSILDSQGELTYTHSIPTSYIPPSALKGLIAAGVSEPGGRAVYNYSEVVIHPYPNYIGLGLDFEGYAKPGEACQLSLISVDHEGKAIQSDGIKITMYRVVYHSILERDNRGYYRYKSEKTLQRVDSSFVDILPGGAVIKFTPIDYGQYLVVAYDPSGGHSTSRSFYASGWGYAPWSMKHPDRIEIDLDRDQYAPGEQAHVQIRAPFGGTLLLTVEKDHILEFITVEMKENTADLKIPINQDYFPNVYITATVIKKASDVVKASPARAFGMTPLRLSTDDRRLPITLTAPKVIKPRSTVTVSAAIGRRGVTHLTLAAVDVGILQLTDHQPADPLEFFYGKKQPQLTPYDIYSLIYPEVEQAQSHLSPPGGRSKFEQARKRHVSPITTRRVKPVALWSGIVTTDQNGKADIRFDVPEFNGTLTLTAVAVQDEFFGAISKEMIVRDNIVIQESFPRFVTPNDIVDGLITIFNNTGAAQEIAVNLDANGPMELISPSQQIISIPDASQETVNFKFKSKLKPGHLSFKVTAVDNTGEQAEINFEIPNRPGQPLLAKYGFGSVTADEPASFDLPGDWLDGTAQTVLQTSSLAAATYTREINYLVRYPYGCLEQTTSGLFPLLYFNDLARFVQPEVFGTEGPDYFIREGIIKLTGLSKPDGGFTFWPNSQRINNWASIYASHFLLEAKAAGFNIDSDLHKAIVKNLKNIARGKNRVQGKLDYPEQVYAAYALTRGGVVENRIVNELRTLPKEALPPYVQYLLAGVFHAAGDREAALELIPDNIMPAVFEPETGGQFSSGVRTNALLLSVLTDIQPDHPGCAILFRSLMEDARGGRWYTTQATAMALMALGKYLSGQVKPDFIGELEIADDTSYTFDTTGVKVTRTDITSGKVDINITGKGRCFYYWQSSGIPTTSAPEEYARGITVKRSYLTADGQPLELKDVTLGTQVICHIEAQAVNDELNNVVINDLLPAGLEIENPRLKTTPRLSWIPKLSEEIDYQDIRDDRLLLFTDLRPEKSIHFFYSLRAISAGEFIIPPISAECMYNPVIAGASSSGIMEISGE